MSEQVPSPSLNSSKMVWPQTQVLESDAALPVEGLSLTYLRDTLVVVASKTMLAIIDTLSPSAPLLSQFQLRK